MNRNLPNIKNDNCYINQYNKDNDVPLNYMLYGGKYENSNLSCSKNNCNTENNWSTIGGRTDVDSFLKNVSLYSGKCTENKNLPCDHVSNNSSQSHVKNKLCENYPVVNNPYLLERKLNPSNLLK
jgi:hypothetical protein